MLSLLFVACSGVDTPVDDAVLDAQLEAATVDSTTDATGTLAVTGEDADYTLTVDTQSFTVHTPGRAAFADEAGLDVSLTLLDYEWPGQVAATLSDADGVYWLEEPGTYSTAADAAFGEGFARYGSSLGQARDGDYLVDYQTVIFATDQGDVEATAGTPVTLTVGGLTWRATVITAYTTEQVPGTPQYDCMGMPDLLAFEVVRVPEPTDWTQLTRDAALDPAQVPGCGG